MKKIVLSLAVLATVALVSCSKKEAVADSESVATVDTNVVDSAATDSAAPVEAPAADTTAADTAK